MVRSVNILKQMKVGERWKFVAFRRTEKAATIGTPYPKAGTSLSGTRRGKRKREAGGWYCSRGARSRTTTKAPLEGKHRADRTPTRKKPNARRSTLP